MVVARGVEPVTYRLSSDCSTIELDDQRESEQRNAWNFSPKDNP